MVSHELQMPPTTFVGTTIARLDLARIETGPLPPHYVPHRRGGTPAAPRRDGAIPSHHSSGLWRILGCVVSPGSGEDPRLSGVVQVCCQDSETR